MKFGFQKYIDFNQQISDKDRRIIISNIVQCMEIKFGFYPNKEEKLATAEAACELFPFLISKTGNKTVLNITL